MGLSATNDDLNAAKGKLSEGSKHMATAEEHRIELAQRLGLIQMALGDIPKSELSPLTYALLGDIILARTAYRESYEALLRAQGDTDGNTYVEQAAASNEQFLSVLQDEAPIYREFLALDQEAREISQELASLYQRASDAYERASRTTQYIAASRAGVAAAIDTITDFQQQNNLPYS